MLSIIMSSIGVTDLGGEQHVHAASLFSSQISDTYPARDSQQHLHGCVNANKTLCPLYKAE